MVNNYSKKLTVALCTYNRANYLGYAIQSILDQCFVDFEFLIMDNHSTDDTINVIRSFDDRRIKHIRHSTNIGVQENFNMAINIADGEYIIIIHDDDIVCSDLFVREIDVLDSDSSILLVSSNCYLMNEKNDIYDVAMPLNENIIYNKSDYIKAFLGGKNFIMTPTVMLRTKILKSNSIFFVESAGPASDVLMWSKINCHEGKFVILKEPLYKYRKHCNQASITIGSIMLYQLIPEMKKCVSQIDNFSFNVERSILIQIIKNIAQYVDDKDKYYNNLKKAAGMEYFKRNLDLLFLIKMLYLFPGLLKLYLSIKKRMFRVV
jgi:glycosyltransferase involved in cell wall biosynthesis